MANTREGDFVYFVHSFYVKGCGDALVAGAEYGVTVPGAVARGNVYGCQFHPEKAEKPACASCGLLRRCDGKIQKPARGRRARRRGAERKKRPCRYSRRLT